MLILEEKRIAKVRFFQYQEAQKYAPQFKNKIIKSKKYQKYINYTLDEYLADIERILERTGFTIEKLEYIRHEDKISGIIMETHYKPVQIFKYLRELSGKIFVDLIEKLEDLYTAMDIYGAKKIIINEDEIKTSPYYSYDELYHYFANKVTDIMEEIKNILQKVLDKLLSDEWVADWVVDNAVEVEIQLESTQQKCK